MNETAKWFVTWATRTAGGSMVVTAATAQDAVNTAARARFGPNYSPATWTAQEQP